MYINYAKDEPCAAIQVVLEKAGKHLLRCLTTLQFFLSRAHFTVIKSSVARKGHIKLKYVLDRITKDMSRGFSEGH